MKLDDAIAASKTRTAVSEAVVGEMAGVTMWIECVVKEGQTPYWVQKGRPGSRLQKAKTSDVDAISQWRPV